MVFRSIAAAVVLTVLPAPSGAADLVPVKARVATVHAWAGPYPLSRRAAKIRWAEPCWRACQADAGRGFQACLRVHGLDDCVARNDMAGLHCLNACRRGAGPWVTLAE